MTVVEIIATALSMIDGLLKIVEAAGDKFSEEDAAKLKLGVINGINKRTAKVAGQEAEEWKIVKGGE